MTKHDDRTWMEMALNEARRSGADVPVGCVLVSGAKVIARAHNEREARQDPVAHAEILALQEAARELATWRLESAIVYVTLEPCPMCAEAIIQARIARVVFGAYDPYSGAAGSFINLFCGPRIYPIPEVVGGIMEDQCKTLLLEFFKSERKKDVPAQWVEQ